MKKIYLLSGVFILLLLNQGLNLKAQGGVGINGVGAPPDNSAGLDVNYTNKGLLMPRLTTLQRDAIVNPAEGLQIYNTDCKVYNFNAGTPSNPNWATINSSNALIAGVSIYAVPAGAICAGTNVTFTATPSSGIGSLSYQWQVNGGNVGNNSASYSTTGLNNGDVVTCVLTSTAPCVSGSPATSNAIVMEVNPYLPASVNIDISPSNSVCALTSVTFTATPSNGGPSPSYQWQINGTNNGVIGPTYTTTGLNNNDQVTCVITSNATCVTGSPATSNNINMTIYSIPASTFYPHYVPVNLATSFAPTVTGATYAWTFTGGSLASSTDQNPSVTWTSTGIDTVTLQVTLNGCSTTTKSLLTVANPQPSCLAILSVDPSSQNGIYTIVPPGGGGQMSVYCDMVTDGGGWTLVGKSDYQSTANSDPSTVNGWPLNVYDVGDNGTGTGKFDDGLTDNIATNKQVWLSAPGSLDYIKFSYSGTYNYTWDNMGVSGLTSSYFANWSGVLEQDGGFGWFLRGDPYDGRIVAMDAGGQYCGGSSISVGPGTQTNINTCGGQDQAWYRYLWFVR